MGMSTRTGCSCEGLPFECGQVVSTPARPALHGVPRQDWNRRAGATREGPELAARHAPNTRLAPRHPSDDHWPTSQEVDVAGELARFMGDNHPIAIGWIEDVDLS